MFDLIEFVIGYVKVWLFLIKKRIIINLKNIYQSVRKIKKK